MEFVKVLMQYKSKLSMWFLLFKWYLVSFGSLVLPLVNWIISSRKENQKENLSIVLDWLGPKFAYLSFNVSCLLWHYTILFYCIIFNQKRRKSDLGLLENPKSFLYVLYFVYQFILYFAGLQPNNVVVH
ncbi:hypothetical protein BC833DRAFT_599635 [Globomyces pollinis-pini]|nr:hypothetical protein BC833DRAFT_599635 [Globomyces pollinis-pini]